ncbi:hypothetical protein [Paludibacter sp.]|uniref:acyltransferase n=1 Tax=Paludibacter sp. TaxID=1898105 RepID=UPI0013561280|nr:hypothetical protein [Paludibacter sp.]MTK52800.1 hypothetical protein [Paludibacter sp.]
MPQVNLLRTILFNFNFLPFQQAIKLPVVLYGKVQFYSLEGKVKIEGQIFTKMIKIGSNRASLSGYDKSTTIALLKEGLIIFKGKADIGMGTLLRINGTLIVGNNCNIGSNSKILCDCLIELGDDVDASFQTSIMDTNFHPLVNLNTKEVHPFRQPIKIGCENWIASSVCIMPGTITKNYTTIASNSMVNKDFSKNDVENMVIGGIPAKILRTNMYRIRSHCIEENIAQHYRKNVQSIYIYDNKGIIDTKD